MADLFADPITFTLLASHLHSLVEHSGADHGLRAWVAGCGSGEDAYAVAILLNQAAARLRPPAALTVFATESDRAQLAIARRGIVPAATLTQLPAANLERFFFPSAGAYHVRAELREQVIVASHRLLADPPFLRLDLVLCRELFAAFSPAERAEALERFAFGLRPNGLLLLGAEPPDELGWPYFRSLDSERGLYARTTTAAQASRFAGDEWRQRARRPQAHAFGDAPHPALVVDSQLRLLHVGGKAERFLQIVPGAPSYNLLEVVRPQLRPTLGATLARAQGGGHAAESPPVPFTAENGATELIRVVVQPLAAVDGDELQVLFVAAASPDAAASSWKLPPAHELPHEVAMLQAQHDLIYEELRVANEELQVANEELRASNEELDLRREELQTLNEQLQVVNREQQRTLAELAQSSADLENLIASTAIGTLFLDAELRLQRYTAPIEQLFNLLPTDRGRPLAHLTHRLHFSTLLDDAAWVRDERRPVEREVQHHDGRWFLVRLRPYYVAGQVTGVVIAFVDISARKQVAAALQRSHDELEARVAERTAELAHAHAARQTLLRELVTAQEAERLRIARELHDTLGQQITAILLGLQAVKEQSHGRAPTMRRLEEIGAIVQTMAREMHEIAVGLRPTALDDVGLAGALHGYVESWSRRTGVAAELFVNNIAPRALPPEVETTLYRVVQEALTNVARHARAGRVSIVLESDGSRVVAVIEDDGQGFDAEAATATPPGQGRLGLLGIQERAALVGGTLTLESELGAGTTLIVRIPLAPQKGGGR